MDLNTIVVTLREQAATTSRIVLDGSVLTDEAVRQKIRAAFALKTDPDLIIAEVTTADIPEPGADGVLTIAAGKASLLEQTNVLVSLTFTEANGTVELVIVAKMSESWEFKDSFKDLETFPFTWLKISHAQFVYTTVGHQSYAWPDEPASKIPLAAGLNFLSQVSPKVLSSVPSPVRELIGDVSRKFYGSLIPKERQVWPVGTLRAPLTDAKFEIGDDTIKLSLSGPKLALRIREATNDLPIQQLDLFVEATFQEALEVAVGIPAAGGALELSVTPLSSGSSVTALIKALPGGNFTQYIPAELSTLNLFDSVGLNNFSLIVNSDRKVSFLGLSIGTVKDKAWELIPLVLKLEHLTLNLETVGPTDLNSTRAHISATAEFLKNIFTDDLSFDVELEKVTSWKVKTISGAYYGAVSLYAIVHEVLGSRVNVPAQLKDIRFSNFGVNVHKETEGYSYSFYGSVETVFPILDHQLISSLNITVTTTGSTTTLGLVGGLVIGEEVFSIVVDLNTSKMTATWEHKGTPLGFADIANAFGWDSMPPLPEGIDLGLKSAAFTYDFKAKTVVLRASSVNYGDIVFAWLLRNEKPVYCLALDVPLGIKFSKFPLVGDSLPMDPPVGVDNLQIIAVSEEFKEKQVEDLNALIAPTAFMPKTLGKGLTLAAKLEMDGPHEVILPLTARPKSVQGQLSSGDTATAELMPAAGSRTALTAPTYRAEPKWFELNKTLGPVHFDKIGVQYQDSTLRFLLNAALSAAGLTLSVDGLSVGSSLKKFEPEFELRGLGVDYKAGDIEIGGAFLRTGAGGNYRYDGAAIIKTKQFTLSALGSYTKVNDQPSLFIYAFLDYPLGGPAFFFVTGLAAGFGYNRKLIAPSIDNVAKFPLITQAAGGKKAAPGNLTEALESLQKYIPPDVGSIFLAVGVKFNSFKLVDSFALLIIEFGNNFAINLLGISKAVVPTPETGKAVTPLAQVEIAWKASFNPDDGCLGIDARLTPNSYILSKDCRLSGGYAFYSWFSGTHAGDFVQTLGGYHPKFKVPDHYPKVPRLAFDWRVSSSLTIQGNAYYALTGSALMAGGYLEVLFKEGELRAWLKVGADFLIAWKPYHYDARLYVNVGASYTFNINLLFTRVRVTISVDVGAELHLWGPEFSGTARIDLSVISFTIAFGAGASQAPEPLKEWSNFAKSFLPEAKDVCSISVKDGLVRKLEAGGTERWVINPKQFSLVVDSAIPFKSAPLVGEDLSKLANVGFGIGPMAASKDRFKTSELTITIKKENVDGEVNGNFKYSLIKKLVPAGLWGESANPEVNDKSFIEDVPAGIEITPGKPPEPGQTAKIDLKDFQYKKASHPDSFKWESVSSFSTGEKDSPAARRKAIKDGVANNKRRAALLADLGVPFEVNIRAKVADDFLSAPTIGTFDL